MPSNTLWLEMIPLQAQHSSATDVKAFGRLLELSTDG